MEYTRKVSAIYENYKFLKIEALANQLVDEPFYLAHFQDFRGRMYSASILSPIMTKIMRYIIKYPKEGNTFLCGDAYITTKVINTYKTTIAKIASRDTREDPKKYAALVFTLIELGKLRKGAVLRADIVSIHISEFIKLGIGLYESGGAQISDPYDILYYKKLRHHLTALLNGGDTDYILLKDSTASVLQHINT